MINSTAPGHMTAVPVDHFPFQDLRALGNLLKRRRIVRICERYALAACKYSRGIPVEREGAHADQFAPDCVAHQHFKSA